MIDFGCFVFGFIFEVSFRGGFVLVFVRVCVSCFLIGVRLMLLFI